LRGGEWTNEGWSWWSELRAVEVVTLSHQVLKHGLIGHGSGGWWRRTWLGQRGR
jgi:hypothetical protein